MFDEAFNNMDDERIGGVLEFLRRLPLQIIIAAPPDKIQYISPGVEQTLPAYFDESSGEYEKIHLMMQQLEDRKLIQILWKDNKKGHVILKVRLNVEEVDRAYAYVKRVPKADRVTDNIAMLEEMRKQTDTPVCKTFIEYLLARLRTNKPVKEFIQLEDLEETQKLLLAVQAVENNKKQLYLREFSIVTFQDSKIFIRHRTLCI